MSGQYPASCCSSSLVADSGVPKADAADRLLDRDLRQCRRAAPAVDRQAQRAAHPRIVKWRVLVVRGDDGTAIPVAFLNGELVAQRAHQLVAGRRREATKLDVGAPASDRRDAGRLFLGENADKPVEIWQPRPVVIGIALARDRLSGLVILQAKRPGAENVFLVPMRVAVEDRLLVEERVRVRQSRKEGCGSEFEVEDDGVRVRRLDLVDQAGIVAALRADDAGWRKDDLVPACRDVVRGHLVAVGELHVVADREGVGGAVIGRLGDFGADVAYKLGRIGRVVRVRADQHAVERRHRVDRRKCVLALPVKTRRCIGGDHIGQRAAALWCLVRRPGG